MRNYLYPVLRLWCLVCLFPATIFAQTTFHAHLSGRSAPLPNLTPARGDVTAVLTGNQLTVSGDFSGLTGDFDVNVAGGAHIHIGYAGQTGGIVFPLSTNLAGNKRSGTFAAAQNTFTLSEPQRNALLNRQWYINIHTTTFPGGEIQGQLLPDASAFFMARLFGSHEVPSVTTAAYGTLMMEVYNTQIIVTGSFQGLSSNYNTAVGSHLHVALPGENGPVTIALQPTLNPDQRGGVFLAADNTFNVSAMQLTNLTRRLLYANIHTVDHPGGEIRGQFSPVESLVFRAHLIGAKERPVVNSSGHGRLLAELNGDSLTVYGTFSGLSTPVATAIGGGAHLHLGLPGRNGDIVFRLIPSLNPDQRSGTFSAGANTFALNPNQKVVLLQRQLYANIHTEAFNGGEIRGQLLAEAQQYFLAPLLGPFEVPAHYTAADGTVEAELNGSRLTLVGAFNNLSGGLNTAIQGGGHIHRAPVGSNGNVLIPLNLSPAADGFNGSIMAAVNSFPLATEDVDALRARELYINIHSLDYPAGEIRGQLMAEAHQYRLATLAGGNIRVPVPSPGVGAVVVELTNDQAVVYGSFNRLGSNFNPSINNGAHLHLGLAGTNAAIRVPLTVTANPNSREGVIKAANNSYTFNSQELTAIRERGMYADIHSVDHPSGELRGQLLPLAQGYFMAHLSGLTEVPPTLNTTAVGGLQAELTGNTLVVTGSFADLTSNLNTSIAGGAHLHIAPVGKNGPVAIPLKASFTGSERREGFFTATDNRFQLTPTQLDTLLRGHVYANIHSVDYPNGEIRGQLLENTNFFPLPPPTISTPFDGATITIAGPGSNMLIIEGDAISRDSTPVDYIWEVSADTNFDQIILARWAGPDAIVATSLNVIDRLLDSLSVEIGQSVQLYHRMVATDGSLSTPGLFYNINLLRGGLDTEIYRASLRGSQEILPVTTLGDGEVTATLMGSQLIVSGGFDRLSSNFAEEIGAHIHLGFAGRNGPVLLPLQTSLSGDLRRGAFLPEQNTFVLKEATIDALRRQELYINIHSVDHPGGELRGQLLPQGDAYYSALLVGANENPAVLTTGRGNLALTRVADTLYVSGSFQQLLGNFDASIGGGAHLHLGRAGENGAVVFPLKVQISADLKSGILLPAENKLVLTSAQWEEVEARRYYANIHTTRHSSGEIRGQVVGMPQLLLRAFLTGMDEPTAVNTRARGVVMAELMNDSLLYVHGAFAGLTSPVAVNILGGAHIHRGLAGTNGGVLRALPITLAADSLGGTFEPATTGMIINDSLIILMLERETYVNIHSRNYMGGEIRGQLLPISQYVFTANLRSAFENPPVDSSMARGVFKAELNDNLLTVTGSYNGLSSPVATQIGGGGHLHAGVAGRNGPVVFPLEMTLGADERSGTIRAAGNQFELTLGQLTTLGERGLYANIHTANYNGGEIRGQLLGEAPQYYFAHLSGGSETDPVRTDGSGLVIAEVRPTSVVISGTFQNMSSGLATSIMGGLHIHRGLPGRNGPIVYPLTVQQAGVAEQGTLLASANSFTVLPDFVDSLRGYHYYVNVHSLNYPGGELRGQFLPLADSYLTASLAGINEVQPVPSDGLGAAKLLINGDSLYVVGSFSGLGSAFAAQVGGGAHLHTAPAGVNGGVTFPLRTTVAADSLSGYFTRSRNAFGLTAAQKATLLADSVYVNIHSQEYRGGELRGQVIPELNFFPSDEAVITQPANGAAITIEGDPTTPFEATWLAASDDSRLVYIWQLARDPNFDTLLFQTNVGPELAFTTDYATVMALLVAAGVPQDGSATLYHRAVAGDGSLNTPGEAAEVTLTRGLLTGTNDPLPVGWTVKGYPTITDRTYRVAISAPETAAVQAWLIDAAGRPLRQYRWSQPNGDANHELDVSTLPDGAYFLQLATAEGRGLTVLRLFVVHE